MQHSCDASTPRKTHYIPFFVKEVMTADRTPYYAFGIYQ
jgi:hypothetical protein